MRLPRIHLSPTAKAQLFGLLVGGALAVLVVNRTGTSWGLFFIGWAGAWALGEKLFGARITGTSDRNAMIIALVSGFVFPWAGVGFAALFEALRP
jgi:hypothetical protein